MSWAVRGAGAVDARGLIRTASARVAWGDGGLKVGRSLRWKRCFEAPFPTFRRLDPLSQLVCLAAEAAGPGVLGDLRPDAALLLGTAWGCLAADVEFAASLAPERDVAPAVFPYTLPSTCLGEVALRHGLRGPTVCQSLELDDPTCGGALLAEALALEQDGASAALVVWGDAVPAAVAEGRGIEPRLTACALLVGPGGPAPGLPSLAKLVEVADPAGRVADALWEASA